MKKMRAAMTTNAGKFVICDVPIPEIGDEELLLRVLVCGTCMSEMSAWSTGTAAVSIPGHEPVGVVEAVGCRVQGFSVGDRVTGMINSAYAEFTKAHYRNLIKVPNQISDVEGIGEPLSCLMSGAAATPVKLGDTAALVGCGFMGLGFIQLLKLKGVSKIIAIDIREESLVNAKKYGASETYNPEKVPERYIVDTWNDRMFTNGVDVAVEVTGTQPGLTLAGRLPHAHGVLSIVGYHSTGNGRNVDMKLWNWKAITVINAHERRNNVHLDNMRAVQRLIEQGRLDVKSLYTHAFSLDEINLAFDYMKRKPENYVKGYIRIAE